MNPAARHKARELALQAIYQWQFTADSPELLEKQFRMATNSKKIDFDYFAKLLHGIIIHCEALDENMRPFLDRDLKELNAVELAALRLAIYELTYNLEIPVKVIINEALELTKNFGSIEGFKYVNAILDKVAHKLRANEF
jgi:transcription antitermination protein NusB